MNNSDYLNRLNELHKFITREEMNETHIDMFFSNLFNHIEKEIADKITEHFYQGLTWYVNNYHLDSEKFGFEFLSYLIFLCDHNLIDKYSLESLINAAPMADGCRIPRTHFALVFPKEYHDYNLEDYYSVFTLMFYKGGRDGKAVNEKFNLIIKNWIYLFRGDDKNGWISDIGAYLYQSEVYDEIDCEDVYYAILNNPGEFIDYLELNGVDKKTSNRDLELVFDNYISMKINSQNHII